MEQEITQFLLSFLSQDLLIMVGVIFVIGIIIKNIPNIPDWTIPIILAVISVAMSISHLAIVVGIGFNGVSIMSGLTQGIIVVGLATYGHQVFKQLTDKKQIDKQK